MENKGVGVSNAGTSGSSSTSWSFFIQVILVALTVISLASAITTIAFFAGDKDNLASVQKNLGIISGVSTGILSLLFIFLYMYLKVKPEMFVPVVFILLFFSFLLSIISTSAAVLQKVS